MFKMAPHNYHIDGFNNRLDDSLKITNGEKLGGDMTLTILGCGEYVLFT